MECVCHRQMPNANDLAEAFPGGTKKRVYFYFRKVTRNEGMRCFVLAAVCPR